MYYPAEGVDGLRSSYVMFLQSYYNHFVGAPHFVAINRS